MVARRVRTAWFVSLVSLAVTVVVVTVAHPGRPLSAALIGVTQLAATATVILRSRGEAGDRLRAWRSLTLAILAYAWTSAFYIVDRHAAMRFPGIADVSIVTYPALLAALVLFWRVRSPAGTPWLMLDGAITGLVLAALVEWLLIAPRIGGNTVALTTYGQVLYATGDTFLLGFLLAGVLLVEWPPARAAPWLGAGLALMSASDTMFAAHVARAEFMPTAATQIGWAAAVVTLAGAATTRPRRSTGPPPRLASVALPACAAAIAVPVVILWRPGDDAARLAIATFAVALAGARLALSLVENIRLLRSARAGEARQAALAELGRRALAGGELDALFTDAARLAAHAITVDFAAVLEYEEGAGVCIRAGYGMPVVPGHRFEGGATMLAARGGQPVVVEDWLTDPRFSPPEIVRRLGGRSAVLVGIHSRGGQAWALGIGARAPRAYAAADVAFLEAVANIVATALDRRHAREELGRLAAARGRLIVETLESEERERRRIAEGLHDLALQELLAAGQELDELERDGSPAEIHIRRARGGLTRAVHDLRETVSELHPVVLEHAGLEPALEAVVRRQAERAGFVYELDVDREAARGREELLVSLARELLANVTRHAAASRVELSVEAAGGGVVLEVRDDGRGVDDARVASAAAGGHIGLASWRERIEAVGGTINVRSGPSGGTTVRAELPAR